MHKFAIDLELGATRKVTLYRAFENTEEFVSEAEFMIRVDLPSYLARRDRQSFQDMAEFMVDLDDWSTKQPRRCQDSLTLIVSLHYDQRPIQINYHTYSGEPVFIRRCLLTDQTALASFSNELGDLIHARN